MSSREPHTQRLPEDWLAVSPVALYAVRLEPPRAGMVWISGSVERLTGATREEALAPGWWAEHLHPADRERVLAALGRIREERHMAVEYRFRHQDGRWLWMRDEFRVSDRDPTEVVGSWSDITPLRQAQRTAEETVLEAVRRLEQSEQRYRSLLDHNPNPVYSFDSDGCFTALNEAAEELIGRPRAEVLGRSYTEVLHPDDLATAAAAFENAWGGTPAEYELRVVRPDGEIRHIRGISAPTTVHGKVVGVYGVATDETRRIEAHARQTELEDRLHQAQKMEAVGRLAGGVAHDFNNLLTGLRGIVGLRLEDLPADDPVRQDLEDVDRIAERASALVRQLLAFSRNQVLRMAVLDLNPLVLESERLLRRMVGEDVRLETELADAPAWVRADPAQLQQVILNLAVNARHAMPDGGRLWLRTRLARLPLGRGGDTDAVVLEVEDTGFGIPRDILDRVFDPFFTTKPPGEGTGLGLSTVHGVVHQCGGDVAVESEPGVGTTFRVVLPRVAPPTPGLEPQGADRREARRTGTILVVEDEATVRTLITRILTRKGYRVVEKATAEEALDWVSAGHGMDLMISDVIMPGTSGAELARQVRQQSGDARILMISGYDADRLAALPAGDVSFLAKPFTPAELSTRVAELLAS